jgi:hypothetical protein
MESSAYDNGRIIDDLNDIAVLQQPTYKADEVFRLVQVISGYEGLQAEYKTLLIKWEDIA